MKKLNLYKVTWTSPFKLYLFGSEIEWIVTDDVNKIYEEYKMKDNLKVKAVKIISVLA